MTYTYQVRNTGDVPLAGVASRLPDDTCANIAYVSGDDDGDGLLDTPNSIFEDAADETWTFTCTTNVTTTTTNTVTVVGTPTDPGSQPLCGPQSNVPAPCDVTDNASATVTVTAPGSITIVKRVAGPGVTAFPFSFAGTAFTLTPDGSRTFDQLAPGTYPIAEGGTTGYTLIDISCQDATGGTAVDIASGTAVVGLAGGDAVTCTFTNTATPPRADLVVTKQASPTLVATGDEVTYTITVTNAGPDAAEGVVLTDPLPAGLTLVDVPPGCTFDGSTITCQIGHLDNGATVTYSFRATVDEAGDVTNTATVAAVTVDPNPDNNASNAAVSAGGVLPPTGSDIAGALWLGGISAVAGAGLIGLTIRRRRRPA